MRAGHIGMIATPAAGNAVVAGVDWVADNGCFNAAAYPGDDAYLKWLTARLPFVNRCGFAVAPDVLCDAAATLERSAPMLRRMRRLGYPVALVAQNGLEHMTVPWDEFDVLFLGGDTAWKLGASARSLTAQARQRGKRVHCGRINSHRRLAYAHQIGCQSADGTYLAFGPDINLPKLLRWLRVVNQQGFLFNEWEINA